MELIVFTGATCPHCAELKRQLKTKGLVFKEQNIDTVDGLADYMFYSQGQMFVPLLVKDGKVTEPAELGLETSGVTELGSNTSTVKAGAVIDRKKTGK